MDGSIVQLPYSPRIFVGRRVTGVARIFYEYRGSIDEDDGPLELALDGVPIVLDVAGDGESLQVRKQAWADPFEGPLSEENRLYVEEHGRWRRVDCSRAEPYAGLIGQIVTDSCALLNEFKKVAGVRISVSTGSMWFVVLGDESDVYWAQPIGFTELKSND